MAKSAPKDPFQCTECGWRSAKWVGRCQEFQTWGTVEEVGLPKKISLQPTRSEEHTSELQSH